MVFHGWTDLVLGTMCHQGSPDRNSSPSWSQFGDAWHDSSAEAARQLGDHSAFRLVDMKAQNTQ